MGNELGMRYIMDGSGNYYTVNDNNQLVVARDRQEAGVFTIFEVNQRIGGSKKSKFYHAIPVDALVQTENEMLAKEDSCKVYSIESRSANEPYASNDMNALDEENDSDKMHKVAETEAEEDYQAKAETKSPSFDYNIENTDWNEFINYFIFISTKAKGYYDSLTEEQSEIDKEICDLLHYVELYDLSDEEGLYAMDLLKDARQRRRDVKDQMLRVDSFQKMLGTSANVTKARTILKDLSKLDKRKYSPRQLDGLFDGMENRMTDRDLYRSERKQQMENVAEECLENIITEEEITMSFVETVLDTRENDWLVFARQQMEFYQNVGQYMVNLQVELDAIDESIEDIMHQIEDANYNVAQGYKVFKELKELRNERKAKAQELEILKTMTECFNLDSMVEALSYNVEAIEKITA